MYKKLKQKLQNNKSTWLITGVAGFIGSNLLEHLLTLDQIVVGLDNFSTGHHHNLDEVQSIVSDKQYLRFFKYACCSTGCKSKKICLCCIQLNLWQLIKYTMSL